MPRKKKIMKLSKIGCVVEALTTSHRVLQSHIKQTTLLFTAMSSDKKTTMTSSVSTFSKADAQQLLAKISPDVLKKVLKSFAQ